MTSPGIGELPGGRDARRWLWLALAAASCVVMVWPARVFATSLPTPSHLFTGAARVQVGHRLLVADASWWGLYAVAIIGLLRAPRRPSVMVSVLTSAGVGIASIAHSAVISNDLYRYAWDGRLQANGIDPYRYPPAAIALRRFHDPWLWPGPGGCAVHLQPPGCTLINRPDVHTIYPPLAQLWFLLEHLLVPQATRDRGYEVVGLLLAIAGTMVVLGFLWRTGRDVRQVAIWSCCPAVAIEAVQSAHVDSLAVVFVVLAVWAAERRRWHWAAAAVAAAGLVKLYPLVLFPAVVQHRRLRGLVIVISLFVVAYLPHVLAVGRGVTGFLGGFLQQEGYVGGSRYQVLHLLGLHGSAAVAVAVLLLAVAMGLALTRRLGGPAVAATGLFTALLFIATPGEPWEDLSLVALAAMSRLWPLLVIVVAEEIGYIAYIFGGLSRAAAGRDYGYALLSLAALFAGWLWRRRSRSHVTAPHQL